MIMCMLVFISRVLLVMLCVVVMNTGQVVVVVVVDEVEMKSIVCFRHLFLTQQDQD